MRQITEVETELDTVDIMVKLTSAFEGIASMRMSQIKDQVLMSEKFFSDLWKIYRQIRVDELFHFGRQQSVDSVTEKQLLILMTSEGGFSGDIDQRLINRVERHYDSKKQDIVIVGHHGYILLRQKNIQPIKYFKMPERDNNINVGPLTTLVQQYRSTTVYYQSYQSLMVQDVRTIELSDAVAERGRKVETTNEIISEENYIFEPSTYSVVDHFERVMIQITLSEVILESKLAQYASRFRAMRGANDKAKDSYNDTRYQLSRAKRHLRDERLKEILNGLKRATA